MLANTSIPSDSGEVLIPIARSAISQKLGGDKYEADETASWLMKKNASFVTLTQNDKLRGCMGTLEAHRALLSDVKANALTAAFHDPRFSPLKKDEINDINIEISLLSALEPLHFINEQDVIQQLKPGVDGIVFKFGHYQSTFLPQVWKQLPDAKMFLSALKHKAGLYQDFWHQEVRLYKYSVTQWKEHEIKQEKSRQKDKM